jgi:hypothetical protein
VEGHARPGWSTKRIRILQIRTRQLKILDQAEFGDALFAEADITRT